MDGVLRGARSEERGDRREQRGQREQREQEAFLPLLPPSPHRPIPPSSYWGGFGRFCGLGAGVLGTGFDAAVEEPPVLRTGRGESELLL